MLKYSYTHIQEAMRNGYEEEVMPMLNPTSLLLSGRGIGWLLSPR